MTPMMEDSDELVAASWCYLWKVRNGADRISGGGWEAKVRSIRACTRVRSQEEADGCVNSKRRVCARGVKAWQIVWGD